MFWCLLFEIEEESGVLELDGVLDLGLYDVLLHVIAFHEIDGYDIEFDVVLD